MWYSSPSIDPKYRRKRLDYELRQHLGKIFHDLAGQKECRNGNDSV